MNFYSVDLSSQLSLRSVVEHEVCEPVQAILTQLTSTVASPTLLRPLASVQEEVNQLWVLLSEVSFSLGNHESAAASFLYLGEGFLRLRDWERAKESCTHALEVWTTTKTCDPRMYIQAHARLALIALEKNNTDAAGCHFREAGELMEELLDPGELVEALIGLSRLQAASGKVDEALWKLRAAEPILTHLNSAPLRASLLLEAGQVCSKARLYLQAIDYLQLAVTMYTDAEYIEESVKACTALGLALEALGRTADAMACFRIALPGMLQTDPYYDFVRSRLVVADGGPQ